MAAHFPLNIPAADQPAPAQGYLVVLCTAPDQPTAQTLAEQVLAEKLAACVTLLPGATSYYRWEGRLERQAEVQMVIKSHADRQAALIHWLKQHHPYQTPEILALPVQNGDADYLSWLDAALR
ncbi:divalent cation tolerance protein CutA [Martelella alba]|uniref:Divalent cation tolerance protein CutA n=1 Tax=Martelella alba TaxID=2590451 RepID=A0ABY2SQW4_9HYPH|nr:divalent cation tolerance protein CutA [Martelella alba]TKI08494.1 divalent cation tolerance protein CutA [Martelella alba]